MRNEFVSVRTDRFHRVEDSHELKAAHITFFMVWRVDCLENLVRLEDLMEKIGSK